jgi:hypothetical protein
MPLLPLVDAKRTANGLLVRRQPGCSLFRRCPGWKKSRSPIMGRRPSICSPEKRCLLNGEMGKPSISLSRGRPSALTDEPGDLDQFSRPKIDSRQPDRIRRQRLRAKALEVWRFYNGSRDLGDWDPDRAADGCYTSPLDFCRSMNPDKAPPRVRCLAVSRRLAAVR